MRKAKKVTIRASRKLHHRNQAVEAELVDESVPPPEVDMASINAILTDDEEFEEDFLPPTTGNCETGVDAISLAQKLMG